MAIDSEKSDFNYTLVRWSFGLAVTTLFMLMSCISPEPLVATITELSACKGWDELGKPIGISRTFLPNEERIFACGQLQVNRPSIALAVNWYYGDKLVFREIIKDAKDYFYSSIEPTGETFLEGTYRIEIVIGKTPVHNVEFRVEQR